MNRTKIEEVRRKISVINQCVKEMFERFQSASDMRSV